MKRSVFHKIGIFLGIFAGSVLLLWFVLFEWNIVPYPSNSGYGPFVCRSPNHEYYVERYQTPIEAIQDQLYAKGVAILYDKAGKELYRGYVDFQGGPMWIIDYDRNVVFFLGRGDWYTVLPSSPGRHPDRKGGCF